MTVKAFAKINIGLQIVRKRTDGYHDIDSIFHRINLFDTLSFRKKDRGIALTTDDPNLSTDTSNLCVKAAEALFQIVGYDGGVTIDLEKRIPYGAGLGGGSADAAATLLALRELLDLQIDTEALANIASTIGADVPYFLQSGTAYAKGTGELLSYFSIELPYWIVLVHPQIHISTPWAYGAFKFNPALPLVNLQRILVENIASPTVWVNKIRNDFEPAVFAEYEDVMRVKEVLYRTGADFALMSGSGSSVFGMFSNRDYAYEAAAFLQKKYPVWVTNPGFSA